METIAIIIGLFLLFGWLKNQSLASFVPQLSTATIPGNADVPVQSNQLPTPNGLPANLQVQTGGISQNAPPPWAILRLCTSPQPKAGPVGLTGGPIIATRPIVYQVPRSNITGGAPNVPSARSTILSTQD